MKIEITEIPANVRKIVINIDDSSFEIGPSKTFQSISNSEANAEIVKPKIDVSVNRTEHADIPEEMNSEF